MSGCVGVREGLQVNLLVAVMGDRWVLECYFLVHSSSSYRSVSSDWVTDSNIDRNVIFLNFLSKAVNLMVWHWYLLCCSAKTQELLPSWAVSSIQWPWYYVPRYEDAKKCSQINYCLGLYALDLEIRRGTTHRVSLSAFLYYACQVCTLCHLFPQRFQSYLMSWFSNSTHSLVISTQPDLFGTSFVCSKIIYLSVFSLFQGVVQELIF